MKPPKAKPQSLPRQRDIRRASIKADLVHTALRDSAIPQSEAIPQVVSQAKDNMVALPGPLFYSTQIPICLWFLAKNKAADAKRGFRDRRKQALFIDARKLGIVLILNRDEPNAREGEVFLANASQIIEKADPTHSQQITNTHFRSAA